MLRTNVIKYRKKIYLASCRFSRYNLEQAKNWSCLAQILKLSEICWRWYLRHLNLHDRQRLTDHSNHSQGLQEVNRPNNRQLHLGYGNANLLTTRGDCPNIYLLSRLSPNCGQAGPWRIDAPLCLDKVRPISPYSFSTGKPPILWTWQPRLLS